MLEKIVSGGQTGVDRAALDIARELGWPHGGWCPRGRRAEDGVIPEIYPLQPTDSPHYAQRTEKNVLDSDGTLILHQGPLRGGTRLTRRLAQKYDRPWLAVDLDSEPDWEQVARWIGDRRIATLNVAGPRESSAPGISRPAAQFLRSLLVRVREAASTDGRTD